MTQSPSKTSRLVRLFLSWVVVLILHSSTALGQSNLSDPLAQDLKKQGDAAMNAGDYDAALDAYTRATSIENSPILLFNRGRALQALERFPEALSHLEAFEREAPEELKRKVPGLPGLISGIKNQVTELTVRIGVASAVATLDGKELDTGPESPVTLVNSGTAVLEVRAKGYEPYKKTLKLPGGDKLEHQVTLTPLDRQGLLRVSTQTPGASVLVDGKESGMAPAELTLTAGKHTVEVKHPKYVPFSTQVVITPKGTKLLDVELEKRPGVLKKWWFWTGVGAAVLAGTAITIAATTERSPDEGDIPPGRVSAPTAMQVTF